MRGFPMLSTTFLLWNSGVFGTRTDRLQQEGMGQESDKFRKNGVKPEPVFFTAAMVEDGVHAARQK